MKDTPFAERLRALMGAKKLTMRAIASACGKTPQAVHKWCNGVAMPSSGDMLTICRIGGCSMEWLFCPDWIDWESTDTAPQGRHAKYWVQEAVAELKEQGLL